MPAALYPADFRARPSRPLCRRRNSRVVTMPESVGPHVRLVFSEMARLNQTYDAVESVSGVRRASLKAWRRKNRPGLESLQAVLSFLGWDYVPVPALETLPPDLAGDVVALARKLEMSVPQLWAAVVAVGVEQKLLNMDIDERRAVLSARESRKLGYGPDRKRPVRLQ